MDVLTASALGRFGRDAAALLLWGGGCTMTVLAPADLRHALVPWWRPVRRGCVVTLGLAVLLLLPIQAAALGDGWGDALAPAVLRGLLGETSIGTAWMAQAAATLALLGAAVLPGGWRDGVTTCAAGLLLAALTLTGHATMHEGWLGAVQRGSTILHLLSGGFWLGALPPLLPILDALARPSLHHAASLALRRFSWLGHGAVALVIGTGSLNVALIVGWPADGRSPYLGLLVAKVALVAVMTVLALVNRYRYVPRLGPDAARATRRIRRATLVEIALGLGAVALVAVFGLLEPG